MRTFLIADIRGYTAFTQQHGDVRGSELAARFAALVRNEVPGWNGELLELRGDEALCVFVSARQALGAAVHLQTCFRRPAESDDAFPLGIGIGLDAGEALPVEGGYRGGALNLAARLCARAAPGEILASEEVVHLARRVDGMRFEHPRMVRFKGLDEQVRVVRVVPSEDLPPPPRAAAKRRRSRSVIAALIVVAASLLGGAALALTSRGNGPSPPRVIAVSTLGTTRTEMMSGASGTYIAEPSGTTDGTIAKVSAATNGAPVWAAVTGIPLGLAVGSHGVWVLAVNSHDATKTQLVHVDDQGRIAGQVTLAGRPGCLDFSVVNCNPVIGVGSVWVPVGNILYKVADDASRQEDAIDTGHEIFDVAYDAGSVWAISGSDLIRVNPADESMTRLDLAQRLGRDRQASHVTASGGNVWISAFATNINANVLAHVEAWRPELSVEQLIAYPAAGAIRAGGALLWVSSSNGWHRLQRLHIRDGRELGPAVSLTGTVTSIALQGRDIWVTTFQDANRRRQLVHLQEPPDS